MSTNPEPSDSDAVVDSDPRRLTECADTVLFAVFAASECNTCPHHWNEETLRQAERLMPEGLAPERMPKRVDEFTEDERAVAAMFLIRLGCIAWTGPRPHSSTPPEQL